MSGEKTRFTGTDRIQSEEGVWFGAATIAVAATERAVVLTHAYDSIELSPDEADALADALKAHARAARSTQ
jgi:hypothetical protein